MVIDRVDALRRLLVSVDRIAHNRETSAEAQIFFARGSFSEIATRDLSSSADGIAKFSQGAIAPAEGG